MKALKLANFLVIALALTVAAVGCKKKPTGVTPLPGQTGPNIDESGIATLENGSMIGEGDFVIGEEPIPFGNPGDFQNTTEDRTAFADSVVYFGFDSALVQASEEYKVGNVAGMLNGDRSNLVRIEGYCDERGTEGYNLALGESRALSLRDALIGAGVDPSRIDTISYGEERPADPGHDEIAWSKNRRGEFILLVPNR